MVERRAFAALDANVVHSRTTPSQQRPRHGGGATSNRRDRRSSLGRRSSFGSDSKTPRIRNHGGTSNAASKQQQDFQHTTTSNKKRKVVVDQHQRASSRKAPPTDLSIETTTTAMFTNVSRYPESHKTHPKTTMGTTPQLDDSNMDCDSSSTEHSETQIKEPTALAADQDHSILHPKPVSVSRIVQQQRLRPTAESGHNKASNQDDGGDDLASSNSVDSLRGGKSHSHKMQTTRTRQLTSFVGILKSHGLDPIRPSRAPKRTTSSKYKSGHNNEASLVGATIGGHDTQQDESVFDEDDLTMMDHDPSRRGRSIARGDSFRRSHSPRRRPRRSRSRSKKRESWVSHPPTLTPDATSHSRFSEDQVASSGTRAPSLYSESRPGELSDSSSIMDWIPHEKGQHQKPFIFEMNEKLFRHPALPPGWELRVSGSKQKPFYIHPDFGRTFYCPIAINTPMVVKNRGQKAHWNDATSTSVSTPESSSVVPPPVWEEIRPPPFNSVTPQPSSNAVVVVNHGCRRINQAQDHSKQLLLAKESQLDSYDGDDDDSSAGGETKLTIASSRRRESLASSGQMTPPSPAADNWSDEDVMEVEYSPKKQMDEQKNVLEREAASAEGKIDTHADDAFPLPDDDWNEEDESELRREESEHNTSLGLKDFELTLADENEGMLDDPPSDLKTVTTLHHGPRREAIGIIPTASSSKRDGKAPDKAFSPEEDDGKVEQKISEEQGGPDQEREDDKKARRDGDSPVDYDDEVVADPVGAVMLQRRSKEPSPVSATNLHETSFPEDDNDFPTAFSDSGRKSRRKSSRPSFGISLSSIGSVSPFVSPAVRKRKRKISSVLEKVETLRVTRKGGFRAPKPWMLPHGRYRQKNWP